MNRRGFTLIELLAVIILLSLVLGIGYAVSGNVFSSAKDKTEEVFIKTLRDAMDIYLDGYLDSDDINGDDTNSDDTKQIKFDNLVCSYNKNGLDFEIYKSDKSFSFKNVINSKYHPISEDDLVNPANNTACEPDKMSVTIYRDNNFVYYYKVDNLNCLNNNEALSNLPEECNG